MYGTEPVLVTDLSIDDALQWVGERLSSVGMAVTRSFDLEMDGCRKTECDGMLTPPKVNTARLVVLLVYGAGSLPVTLFARGDNQVTEFSIVSTPQQRSDTGFQEAIRQMLLAQELPQIRP